MMKNQISITILAGLLFFQLACGSPAESNSNEKLSEPVVESTDNNFSQNFQLWKSKEITNYSFVISRFGGGLYGWVPVSVEVKDNKAISIKPARKKLELVRIDGYENFDTIDKLFAQIQDSYAKKHRVEITYNKDFGYPERINIDDYKTIHSGYLLEISKFRYTKDNLRK